MIALKEGSDMNAALENMIKGLVLHFLHGGTVKQAVAEGPQSGLPGEVPTYLPGMVFQASSAAAAVQQDERQFDEILDQLVAQGAPRQDADTLVKFVLGFLKQLSEHGGGDRPVPSTGKSWYNFGPEAGQQDS